MRPGRLAIGVSRCNTPNCKLCENIIETDKIFFSKLGCYFRINTRMDCTVRNVIYALFCGGCAQSYIGETVCLRERTNSHRSNSKSEDKAVMEVSKHLAKCGQGFKICPIVKVKEECKILRLVIEARLIGGGASRRPRKRYTLKKPQSRSKCKKPSATSSQPIFPSCVKVVNPPWRALFKRVLYHHPNTQSQILLHISKI